MVVVVGSSLVSGLGLRGPWGAPALRFAGIAAVLLAGQRLRPAARPVLAIMAAVFLLATSLGSAAITLASPTLGKIKRQNVPQAAIAVEMRRIYADATGRTLTIIATEGLDWAAARAGLSGHDMLDVTSDPPSCRRHGSRGSGSSAKACSSSGKLDNGASPRASPGWRPAGSRAKPLSSLPGLLVDDRSSSVMPSYRRANRTERHRPHGTAASSQAVGLERLGSPRCRCRFPTPSTRHDAGLLADPIPDSKAL